MVAADAASDSPPRFRAELTRGYRQLVQRLGVAETDEFRVFDLGGGWLGVRDQQAGLVVVSADGQSLASWTRDAKGSPETARQRLAELDHLTLPPSPGDPLLDVGLALDLCKQYSHEFLGYAVLARWRELGRPLGWLPELTDEYREVIAAVAPSGQRQEMRLFAWRERDAGDDRHRIRYWLGVRIGNRPLFAHDDRGRFLSFSDENSPEKIHAFAVLAGLPTEPLRVARGERTNFGEIRGGSEARREKKSPVVR